MVTAASRRQTAAWGTWPATEAYSKELFHGAVSCGAHFAHLFCVLCGGSYSRGCRVVSEQGNDANATHLKQRCGARWAPL